MSQADIDRENEPLIEMGRAEVRAKVAELHYPFWTSANGVAYQECRVCFDSDEWPCPTALAVGIEA